MPLSNFNEEWVHVAGFTLATEVSFLKVEPLFIREKGSHLSVSAVVEVGQKLQAELKKMPLQQDQLTCSYMKPRSRTV